MGRGRVTSSLTLARPMMRTPPLARVRVRVRVRVRARVRVTVRVRVRVRLGDWRGGPLGG